MAIRVTIWNEFRHEKENEGVKKVYPKGLHVAIGEGLEKLLGGEVRVNTAWLDQPEHGLTDEILNNTDVMLWWGHAHHGDVRDDIAAKVAARVRLGMGLMVLHSGHLSKPFKLLMGTSGFLSWREAGEKERLWNVIPGHPITAGLSKDYIELEHEEMYGEHFDIPTPDELVFISWFEGGEVFRSGCIWQRGAGKVFYFRPGHESFPTYYQPDIQQVVANAVKYLAPVAGTIPARANCPNIKKPLSPIAAVHHVDESLHAHTRQPAAAAK